MGVFCLMDDEGVIHIPKPYSWRVGGGADGSGLDVLHKEVGYQWANGGTHGHTMYLFIILTLKHEDGSFEGKLQ